MKNKAFFVTLLLFSLFGVHIVSGQDTVSTFESLIDLFGIDANAGQNSFLTLTIPSGGRCESMGSAYTAVTLDSGFIDSNPATSSYMTNTELSFYHNNWISDTNIETLAFTSHKNNFGFGVAAKILYIPFTGYSEWGAHYLNEGSDSYATGFYSETIATLNFSYNFFESFYFGGLAVGGNLKLGIRGVSESLAEDQSGVALMGDIGILAGFNLLKFYSSRDKNLKIGVVAKNLGAEFIDDPDPLPSMVTTGIAYAPIRPLLFAIDFSVPFNLNGEDAELPYGAGGINVSITNFWDMQLGVLIKTGKPRISFGSTLVLKKFTVDINYTLDMTTQLEAFDRMSISLRVDLGDFGDSVKKNQAQLLYLDGLKLYSKGRYQEAIKLWEKCLNIDSEFTPAKEMIETTKKTMELDKEIREGQKINL